MLSSHISATLLTLMLFLQHGFAQSSAATVYTDPDTGIIFDTWSSTNMKFGFTFPSDALNTDASEFIGILQCASTGGEGTGWCGLSFGGSMTNTLLLMAYPHEDEIYTAFKWATAYEMPVPYSGSAKLSQISSTINETHYTLIYRCEGCLSWDQDGTTGKVSTSSAFMLLGWCQASASPGNPGCPDSVTLQQHDSQSIFGAVIDSNAANAGYSKWAALATSVVSGSCDGGGGSTTTTTAIPTATGIPVPSGTTYDYIVIGGGAGGIPIADKLSEAGKSVLLIEKGPPSSGRWGGDRKPEWLEGTNLTRFDVPGLCNQIWHDATGIACKDTDQMAGCVLGGGTAVNAGLWWKPNPTDWDYNFPTGWKASDMTAATSRVFSRIPGTMIPSKDGKLYLQQGFDVLTKGLKTSGWTSVAANDVPGQKNHTYTHTPYMFSNGERGGPMATYLVSASQRKNFHMWTNTQVKRVIRTGGHITGVEVEPYASDGYSGVVKVTATTGRVILSAGTFGSAKILLRSGIGPTDQLDVVQSSADGATMIGEDEWINTTVGYNLEDHVNTDTVVTHPDVVYYDFYQAYDDPIQSDADAYLGKRSGILAQAAPNIGPLFFDEIKGADGVVRQLQWTARVEASLDVESEQAITMSQYLGRGAVSRGRMTINSGLNTVVSTVPYLRDKNDVEAVIAGIENLQAALANVKGLVWRAPAAGVSARDFVNNMVVSYSNRRANHWIGTNKMGTKDGRTGGDAVVDTNTKVYGTDNLFVVDASIFPGMVTTNPSAYVVTVSEHASQKILALALVKANAKYGQCGGLNWTGSYACVEGSTCAYQNAYYSQCL
ncbi:cellobiose dehydrogenase [Stylonectria norvegica]|nr:cellobiose dehydrogenase [Stylonectria norvegica]